MRDSSCDRIGIFDSGVGGLTVLKQLHRRLPHESILYFADTARLPYGTRSQSEILQFVREILSWMESERVKMVIMACNTSSALALEAVQTEFTFPILGLILPGARAAVTAGKRIGVVATPATAVSGAYRRAILEIDDLAQVWEVGCPEFVPLIEANRLWEPYTRTIAQQYLSSLLAQNIDTLIYGCTHYRHLSPLFTQLLPPAIHLIDPAEPVVSAAEQELELMGLANPIASSSIRFCTSGSPDEFAHKAQQWLGYRPTVEAIDLACLSTIHG
ncbi:MAG: glutamate racemase [Chloroflexaceae bacterium]|nr:glutamate racemase [Chloroflexaceae bacterium]